MKHRIVPYMPGALQQRFRPLVNARKLASSICVAIVAALLLKPDLLEIVTGKNRTINDFLYFGLLAVNALLGACWVWVTDKESDLLVAWLDPKDYEPPTDIREWLMILGLGVLIVVQLLSVRYPIAYGIIWVTTSASVLLSVKHVNTELKKAIDHSRDRLRETKAIHGQPSTHREENILIGQALDALEDYFIKQPHIQRYEHSIFFGLLGLSAAIAANAYHSEQFNSLAYFIYLAWLITSEARIISWRYARDAALRPIEAERYELIRACQSEIHKHGQGDTTVG